MASEQRCNWCDSVYLFGEDGNGRATGYCSDWCRQSARQGPSEVERRAEEEAFDDRLSDGFGILAD